MPLGLILLLHASRHVCGPVADARHRAVVQSLPPARWNDRHNLLHRYILFLFYASRG